MSFCSLWYSCFCQLFMTSYPRAYFYVTEFLRASCSRVWGCVVVVSYGWWNPSPILCVYVCVPCCIRGLSSGFGTGKTCFLWVNNSRNWAADSVICVCVCVSPSVIISYMHSFHSPSPVPRRLGALQECKVSTKNVSYVRFLFSQTGVKRLWMVIFQNSR